MPPDRTPSAADVSEAVARVAESLIMAWGRALESLDTRVSPSQLRVMVVVSRNEGINLGGLADAIGAIPSSASRLCDRLQAAGLLNREVCVGNRREVTLALSADGRALLAELAAIRQADIAAVMDRMSPSGRQALLAGLTEFQTVSDLALDAVRPDGSPAGTLTA